jgi:hypothetical protein
LDEFGRDLFASSLPVVYDFNTGIHDMTWVYSEPCMAQFPGGGMHLLMAVILLSFREAE